MNIPSNGTNRSLDDVTSGLTVAEYFAGIGLVRMGLEQAGWRVIFANDWSPHKAKMYHSFFPDSRHYVTKDIFSLDASKIPTSTLATCSFPCIDLSLAGNMKGFNGKHSSAFGGFTKILSSQGDSAPPLILVENVPGWLSSNGGADFRVTIQSLNDRGYSCDVFVLDALRFTPQSRRRVFLVGSRKPMERFNLNTVLHRSDALSSDRLKACIVANSDLSWMSLTIPEPPPLLRDGLAKNVIEKLHPRDKRWWSEKEVERHLGMMANAHLKTVLELQDRSRTSYKTFYRRRRSGKQRAEMRTDDIAGCLRTAVGGSSRQFLVVAGNGKVRMRNMTSREYARLQGVPDNYTFDIEERHALTGFGDAVCVPAIAWIANNVLTPLTKTLCAPATPIAQPAIVSMPA